VRQKIDLQKKKSAADRSCHINGFDLYLYRSSLPFPHHPCFAYFFLCFIHQL